MKVAFEIPQETVEQVVHELMQNFPEASDGSALSCIGWDYEGMRFRFRDDEDGRIFELDKAKLVAAFPLLFSDKWPAACTAPPASGKADDWDDWLCQADANDFDAFVQLACFGEVIYG